MDPNQLQPQAQQSIPSGKAPAMATPEQRQELFDLVSQVRDKLGGFNAVSFASQNQSEQLRMDLLKDIFSQLSAAGVDLTDPKSVSDFMSKLKIQNPELAQMLEEALNTLLGSVDGGQGVPVPPTGEEVMGGQPAMEGMPNAVQ